MERSCRNRSPKFKAKVMREALLGESTLAQWASRHGVHAIQIAAWAKQLLERAGEVLEGGNPAAEDAEQRIRELQAKVVRTPVLGVVANEPILWRCRGPNS